MPAEVLLGIVTLVSMTRTQARAFRERWRRVARAEAATLRRLSMEDRLGALAVLMASAGVIGGPRRLAAEDAAVRRRWSRLRRTIRA